jgi:hypothetical protein
MCETLKNPDRVTNEKRAYFIAVIVGLATSVIANTFINSVFKVIEGTGYNPSYPLIMVITFLFLIGVVGYGVFFLYRHQ